MIKNFNSSYEVVNSNNTPVDLWAFLFKCKESTNDAWNDEFHTEYQSQIVFDNGKGDAPLTAPVPSVIYSDPDLPRYMKGTEHWSLKKKFQVHLIPDQKYSGQF